MRLPWRRGYIESAAWLADDTLLAVGWCLAPAESLLGWTESAGQKTIVELRALGISRADLPDRPHAVGKVMILRFPALAKARTLSGTLAIDGPAGRFTTSPRALQRVLGRSDSFVSARLGWLDEKSLARLQTFLADTLNTAGPSALDIAASLRRIRQVLGAPAQNLPSGDRSDLLLTRVLRIDDCSFYIRAWLRDGEALPPRLELVSPEGLAIDLLERAHVHLRFEAGLDRSPEADLLAHVVLPGPSFGQVGWSVEAEGPDGSIWRSVGPPVESDIAAVRKAILEDVGLADPAQPTIVAEHTFPALQRLQERHKSQPIEPDVLEFGTRGAPPDVSIVIPVFKRIDLLEHQFAHWITDRLEGAELVYVLDSPDIEASVKQAAVELFDLYRIPFRMALLPRHLGFSLAVNTGASLARGRLLLLLNSDVFPARAGWLQRMTSVYDATPRIGALGPKLLYEDDTLQHAGLYFERPPGCAVWMNKHYFKGFDRNLPAANIARRVPAVTGACMMIGRELFLSHGGLSASYVSGDYEDSDLCLRLLAAGYDNWYLPGVELYHLEGQSYDWDSTRRNRAFYNAWLHDHLWHDVIQQVMPEYPHQPHIPTAPA